MLREEVATLAGDGHEIGCHGLTHTPDEAYSVLPLADQRVRLTEATERITKVVGSRPVSFRSPAFKISGPTMRVLDELGYRAEASVNSQRAPLLGADMYNWRPLCAPRKPYHPSYEDACRRGGARVWEIPVSAWILPFVANTERLFGLRFVRQFFRALHTEAQRTGKPIVFMFHAEELNADHASEPREPLSWRHFLPSPVYGLRFREHLFDHHFRRIEQDLNALLKWVNGFEAVRFMSVRDYVARLDAVDVSTAG